MAYKDDYEKFKLKMTVISMLFTILNLYIFNYRYATALATLLKSVSFCASVGSLVQSEMLLAWHSVT